MSTDGNGPVDAGPVDAGLVDAGLVDAGLVDGGMIASLVDAAGRHEQVVGIGTDLVDLDRFRTVLDRTPTIVDRVFTDGEQRYARRREDPTERFGARFAAKEATMKALGVGLGQVVLRDIEVVRAESGAPSLTLRGSAREAASAAGVRRLLVTLSHTEHLAQAVVVALGEPVEPVDPEGPT